MPPAPILLAITGVPAVDASISVICIPSHHIENKCRAFSHQSTEGIFIQQPNMFIFGYSLGASTTFSLKGQTPVIYSSFPLL
jgi:hypothetical protein